MNTGPNYENFKSPRVYGMFYFLPELSSYFYEKELPKISGSISD